MGYSSWGCKESDTTEQLSTVIRKPFQWSTGLLHLNFTRNLSQAGKGKDLYVSVAGQWFFCLHLGSTKVVSQPFKYPPLQACLQLIYTICKERVCPVKVNCNTLTHTNEFLPV